MMSTGVGCKDEDILSNNNNNNNNDDVTSTFTITTQTKVKEEEESQGHGNRAGCCCQQPSCAAFQRLQGLRAQVLDLESRNDLAGRYGQVCFAVSLFVMSNPCVRGCVTVVIIVRLTLMRWVDYVCYQLRYPSSPRTYTLVPFTLAATRFYSL
jgi:hypothetical protein